MPPLAPLLAALLALGPAQAGQGPARSIELHDEGYVGSGACRECHAKNYASWHASFHRTMTQAPSSASVLAPFRGTTPLLEGRAWALAQDGDAFFATPLGPDGKSLGAARRVALTTGAHHYQVYWMASPSGELEQLPLLWHVGEQRWVPRKATFVQPPGPSGEETDRWQEVCIKCHTTNGTPEHPASGATRVAELGIACEACHGPGERHVAWRRSPAAASEALEPDTGLVNPKELDHVRSSQVCGQCHGVYLFGETKAREQWLKEGFAYRPGDDLSATRTLLLGKKEKNGALLQGYLEGHAHILPETFWPDGEVRVSGRDYNGIHESPCFQRGEMSCLSCHELHVSPERVAAGWSADQLQPGMDGPRACLQCHAKYAEPEARRAHTHHADGSSGSDCLNCHMPYTTYGLTKAIRSHTISSPSAAVAAAAKKPSACNLCHLDRSLGWTSRMLGEWYGQERVVLDPDRETIAASVLWTLTGDAGLRALAASALGWAPARAVSGTGWNAYLLSTLLLDDYDAVRWIAQRAARLEPRYASLSLDFCAELEEQRNAVRGSVLSDWLREGLKASEAQRAAVLVREGGKLDEAAFRRLFATRDVRAVRLGE